jgi:triosephosphate isomerase
MDGSAKFIWIIANWKSNKSFFEAKEWVEKVGPNISKNEYLKIVVCPPFSYLSEIKKIIKTNNFPLMVGSQDLSPFGVGAYTGEEPAALIKDFIDLSIIGHSERRHNFGETDQMVEKKVDQAVANNIIPLVCIQDKDTSVPVGCKLVAYEPVWAIGSGNADTPENDEEIARAIKNKYGQDVEVLCGGSVNSTNIVHFLSQPNINGALIGGASLDAEEFIKIYKIASERV